MVKLCRSRIYSERTKTRIIGAKKTPFLLDGPTIMQIISSLDYKVETLMFYVCFGRVRFHRFGKLKKQFQNLSLRVEVEKR